MSVNKNGQTRLQLLCGFHCSLLMNLLISLNFIRVVWGGPAGCHQLCWTRKPEDLHRLQNRGLPHFESMICLPPFHSASCVHVMLSACRFSLRTPRGIHPESSTIRLDLTSGAWRRGSSTTWIMQRLIWPPIVNHTCSLSGDTPCTVGWALIISACIMQHVSFPLIPTEWSETIQQSEHAYQVFKLGHWSANASFLLGTELIHNSVSILCSTLVRCCSVSIADMWPAALIPFLRRVYTAEIHILWYLQFIESCC